MPIKSFSPWAHSFRVSPPSAVHQSGVREICIITSRAAPGKHSMEVHRGEEGKQHPQFLLNLTNTHTHTHTHRCRAQTQTQIPTFTGRNRGHPLHRVRCPSQTRADKHSHS